MKIVQLVLALVFITVVLSSSLVNPGTGRFISKRSDYSYQDTVKYPKHKSDSTNKKMSGKKHGDSARKQADSVQKKYPG